MAYADTRRGWNLPGLAATAAAHLALLVVAASAFGVDGQRQGERAEALAVFDVAPPKTLPAEPEPTAAAAEVAAPLAPQRPPAGTMVQGDTIRPAPATSRAIPAAVAAPVPFPAAPAAAPADPAPAVIAPPAPASEGDALARYVTQLRAAILQRRPGGLGKAGTVTVTFRLDRSGNLVEARVGQSCGDVRLDRAALRMVRQAAPFPPPDAAIGQDRLSFTIPVRFH